jgi:hypothetical protein
MSSWPSVGHRIRHVGRRGRFDAEMETELRFHVDSHIEDLERAGQAHEEAVTRPCRARASAAR